MSVTDAKAMIEKLDKQIKTLVQKAVKAKADGEKQQALKFLKQKEG